MSDLLTYLVPAVLLLAACADYSRRAAANPSKCLCGCGDPIQKHNQPRSVR